VQHAGHAAVINRRLLICLVACRLHVFRLAPRAVEVNRAKAHTNGVVEGHAGTAFDSMVCSQKK
jgi:hypothetical protein